MTADTEVTDLARRIRVQALRMVARSNASHIGSCLSMADILAVLYSGILRYRPDDPDWADRDRFILSKGHGAAVLYAVLAESGYFPLSDLEQYCCDGSVLMGHASHYVPGVEVSTGSLGHGLPIGAGMALAAARDRSDRRVYVLVGDGELDEGSNWEALLFASSNRLDRLVAIVDRNGLQGFGEVDAILDLEPLAAKVEAFGWEVVTVDGHDVPSLEAALSRIPRVAGKPTAIIADTIKGKGVSFMEGRLDWHYRSPDSDQLQRALRELGVSA